MNAAIHKQKDRSSQEIGINQYSGLLGENFCFQWYHNHVTLIKAAHELICPAWFYESPSHNVSSQIK